ncbi:glycosyltransferase [Oscillatoria sp. FACHB-1407]|nr:glycosyltransferase [Oscillatoria sp. FACHB-1407]
MHLTGLLLWTAIGVAIRFTGLDTKPPWTDEFATLVFSLGHSFETVPLDQAISLETLLQPLQLRPQATVQDVVQQLLTADVHPPLYFVLAHLWMHWFSPTTGLVSIAVARSLPALLGVLTIPAMFGLGYLIERGQQRLLLSHTTAAFMAVAPYGVYLAQEARHYTLAMLWVIASLVCLVLAERYLRSHIPPPLWLCGAWIGVNGLGMATHYFFGLTLAAIALAFMGFALQQYRADRNPLLRSPWQRLYAVALGTGVTASIWAPIWLTVHQRDITQWIQSGDRFHVFALIKPLFQWFGTWLTMWMLLPVEASWLPLAVVSVVLMIAFFWAAIPTLWRGFQRERSHPDRGSAIRILGGFVVSAIALFFGITYGFGNDLTRGARYSFVYFPGVVALFGVGMTGLWQTPTRVARGVAIAILIMGLAGGLTVVNNLGYQKYYRPDRLVPLMQQSQEPILIATTHNTLVQVGEMMGLGWEWQRQKNSPDTAPQFLLVHQDEARCTVDCPATATLDRTLTTMPRPFQLWAVNFHAPVNPEGQACVANENHHRYVNGYDAYLYQCN